ncbi:hypothetical protein VKT23_015433 [Stygiomarasmius scandens]|uniref:Uncharacterized protein n=1 Tax=Marasmiellus scandens TaxID=2682957 RepID=A0ABR1IXN1_9AGAR
MAFDWEELIYTAAEFIPSYGTLYSFRRMDFAFNEPDGRQAWISGIRAIQGIAWDILLSTGQLEPIHVVVVHGLASVSHNAADLLTASRKPIAIPDYTFQEKFPRDDGLVRVLRVITGETRCDCDEVIECKLRSPGTNHFIGILSYHRAVYMGKFNMDKYASNENFFLVLPEGLKEGGTCYMFTAFTQDASGTQKRPLTNVLATISLDRPRSEFIVRSNGTGEWYWFIGRPTEKGGKIVLKMFDPNGEQSIATIELVRQTKSIA